ncbi:DUF4145 domain-containing protein [Reinekea blandensis]|uniref:DUF4145 domain-containing protein n=1 Tax=Reinekea blandensis MED297 TaxID=314283 RepID=A4BFX0_9GAMM|nr:DUF4145 domain-containing protein [Reinekea blandensis]EAR08988.1 hypothetical protein MED297_03827 [Reinekea sp. MED297] [Reinekea blandensis MED297]
MAETALNFLDVLIWPVIVLTGLFLFRQPLLERLSHANKLKYKDLEIEFSEDIQTVQQVAQQAFPIQQQDIKAQLLARAVHFPSTTIRDAWREVDQAALALLQLHDADDDISDDTRFKDIADALMDENLLSTKQIKLFHELRRLRNKAAHAEDFTVSTADAIQYVELCFRVIDSLITAAGSSTVKMAP